MPVELSEIAAMESALDAYRARVAELQALQYRASFFGPGAPGLAVVDALSWVVNEAVYHESARASEVYETARANLDRFVEARNALIESDPPDHEGVLNFVEGVRRIAGDPLPALLAAEQDSSSLQSVAGGAAADTARQVYAALPLGAAGLLLLGLALAGLYVWGLSRA